MIAWDAMQSWKGWGDLILVYEKEASKFSYLPRMPMIGVMNRGKAYDVNELFTSEAKAERAHLELESVLFGSALFQVSYEKNVLSAMQKWNIRSRLAVNFDRPFNIAAC